MQRIGILGAGFMGKTHADAYKTMENATLVAVCDQNAALGDEFAAQYGCTAFTDAAAMLEGAQLDVLDICLPTFLHEEHALLGARHQKHVFCEKPVALGLPAFDRMAAAVEGTGRRLLVGQVVRFWPEYAKVRHMLAQGAFGDIKAVHAGRVSVHPSWSAWYRKAQNSGGGLFDLHLHDVDYLCSLFGRPQRVYAVGKQNADGCWNHVASTLRFTGGVDATAEGIIEMQEGYPFTMELRVVGGERSVEYRMRAGHNLENVAAAQRESWVYGDGTPHPLGVEPADAYGLELAYFVDCLESGAEPELITTASVRATLETILAIQQSLETGHEVSL